MPFKETPIIWVLNDDRAGNNNQGIGVAERLGFPFTIKKVEYTSSVKLPNSVRGKSLLGIDTKNSDPIEPPWPDLLINTGRRAAPLARYIKKQSAGKTFLVQLMWPDLPKMVGTSDFDLIATPEHDGIPEEGNVITTIGAANRIDKARIREEAELWKQTFDVLPSPRIALLVGGDTKDYPFSEEHARELGELATQLAESKNGSLLISNSRRTSEEATKALIASVKCPNYFYDWRSGHKNPYFAILGRASGIIVTGDSMSQCSEACTTGKPVYVYTSKEGKKTKHALLHQQLIANGCMKRLVKDDMYDKWKYEPLDTTGKIADAIVERIKKRQEGK